MEQPGDGQWSVAVSGRGWRQSMVEAEFSGVSSGDLCTGDTLTKDTLKDNSSTERPRV